VLSVSFLTTATNSIALHSMADSADEPLMRHEPETDYDQAVGADLSDVSLLLEKNLRHPGLFVWLLTFSAGISGLLFGCTYPTPRKQKEMADEIVQTTQESFPQRSSLSIAPSATH